MLVALPWPASAAGRHPLVEEKTACVTKSCHASLGRENFAEGSIHDPVAAGDCRSCHDLALAAEARFVKGAPSGTGEDSGGGRIWDLALCLGCHGEGILAPHAPAMETGFADGKRNLHALHVQVGRGRRCLSCHEPHAARQPQLLRSRIPSRGKARIAQEFRGEPQGGWCRTGCHAPKRYQR